MSYAEILNEWCTKKSEADIYDGTNIRELFVKNGYSVNGENFAVAYSRRHAVIIYPVEATEMKNLHETRYAEGIIKDITSFDEINKKLHYNLVEKVLEAECCNCLNKCQLCDGNGTLTCDHCDSDYDCPECDGTGLTDESIGCELCGNTGKIIEPLVEAYTDNSVKGFIMKKYTDILEMINCPIYAYVTNGYIDFKCGKYFGRIMKDD